MAKRFTKPCIQWSEMEKMVPPDQKNKFLAFKAKADAYLRRVLANPPEPPKIDWDDYAKQIPAGKDIVCKLKSAYEAYKVPMPEDTLTAAIDAQWASLKPEIEKFCTERQKDIEAAEKELKRVEALPKFEDMTLEMFAELYPDQALDSVNRPTFWPHNPEEQLDYKPPQAGHETEKAAVKKGDKK